MNALYKISVFLILLFWQLVTFAQTETTVSLDTNAILIGDQTKLTLKFSCPADYKVIWPDLRDTLIKEIEILNKTRLESVLSNDKYNKIYSQEYTITGFDSGYYAIPPIRIYYKVPGDTVKHFTESDAQLLGIHTVSVDSQADIKDIKQPIKAPFTIREAMPYIIGFLVAVLLTFLIIYFIRKRKKAEPIFRAPAPLQVAAHRLALDSLETLRHKKLWQNGEIKLYHTELTDIIREYLYNQFDIHALEYTSDEIMEAVQATRSNNQAKEKLRQTLQLADMVKFAKMEPTPVEHDASLNNAIDFVRETMHLNKIEKVNGAEQTFKAKTENMENDQVEPVLDPELNKGKGADDVE